ncbi:hypothetical protein N431DRAFT_437754 [Stipitochalara longipes BDJ]|nr:hypothetical protein N431DRAFT_437754 [Stipitochalara longipes BDJ]
MVRAGSRWQQLIDAVASPEILFIDLDDGKKNDEGDSNDDENKMPSARNLEKEFYKDFRSLDIGKITQSGDDALFAKMKELLIMPDLQLKETCQRLSGLSQLVNRLGEAEKDFNLDDDDDDDNVLHPSAAERTKCNAGNNSELISSLCSEIRKRIKAILWKPDSGFDPDINPLLSNVTYLMVAEIQRNIVAEFEVDGRESSSNDDGSEETCESNVGGQNGELDDDFCIQFLNSDALA